MKAKELAEELLKYPDFEVELCISDSMTTWDSPWPKLRNFDCVNICDIAHSDKIIVLDGVEK